MPEKVTYHQPVEIIPIVMATPSEDIAWGESSQTEQQSVVATTLPVPEAQLVTVAIDEPENEATPLVVPCHQQHHPSEGEGRSSVSSQLPAEHQRQTSTSFHDEADYDAAKQSCSFAGKFRDWPFAVLFWIHLVVIIHVGLTNSSAGYERVVQDFNWTQLEQHIAESDDVSPEDLTQMESFIEDAYEWVQGYVDRIILYSMIPAAISAILLVDLTLTAVRPCTTTILTLSLLGSVITAFSGALAILIAQPSVFGFFLACLLVVVTSFFACTVWPLRSFVGINLKVSLEGMAHNLGTYLWAIFFSNMCVVWVVFWFYTLFGLSFLIHIRCEDQLHRDEKLRLEKDDDDECNMGGGVFILLVLSLYWTTNVIINYLRCTIAGVMATWLYAKEDAKCCCSSAIWGSLMRGATYSFGSICFGSLVQGFVEFLRCIITSAKRNRTSMTNGHNDGCCGGLCFCIIECVADLGGDTLDYFSQWNYIYIALYGYTYVESGKAVMRLFRTKGWELNTDGSMSIISERLTSYVLGSLSIAIGITTGTVVLFTERIVTGSHQDSQNESYVYGPLPNWRIFAFLIGFLIGLVMSSILMHVVKGAVNTLIVCWADNCSRIEAEHPAMSHTILEAWQRSFPHSSRLSEGPIPIPHPT